MFDLPYVPTAKELIDVAFRQGRKIARNVRGQKTKNKELKLLASESRRVNIVGRDLEGRLESIVEKFPSYEQLPEFYQRLLDLEIDKDRYKKSLGAVNWCYKKIRDFRERCIGEMRSRRDKELSKRFLGRVSSIIERISGDLDTLIDIKMTLLSFPVIKEEPTLVVAGYPNAGKSTFVSSLTGSNIKVAAYPFTTQSIMIGKVKVRYFQYQIIDSPGLLDRPMDRRNIVEKEAVLALKYLANVILFLVDPTGDIDKQVSLLSEVKELFKTRIVVGVNKVDVADPGVVSGLVERLSGDYEVCTLSANSKEDCLVMLKRCF
ncbi:MAG: 50S ribosome-binding GTPase, partial [Candidatus Altiarchaeota archaeon]|nr:50S ribosome-binding GTPase [Candidatus Altiarchaeota archaeon]